MSSCGATIPGTVCPLKLAPNTKLNYHPRQVAGLLWVPLTGGQTKAEKRSGKAGKEEIHYIYMKPFQGLKPRLTELCGLHLQNHSSCFKAAG